CRPDQCDTNAGTNARRMAATGGLAQHGAAPQLLRADSSIWLRSQPGVTDAALLVVPPSVALATLQQTFHRHEASSGRNVKSYQSVLLHAFASDSQRCEFVEDPLSRALEQTVSEWNDPDGAVARPLQTLVTPQPSILVTTDTDQVAVRHSPHEPWRVL